MEKLEEMKYKLYQQQASGSDYLEALAQRRLAKQENRIDTIRVVNQIGEQPRSVSFLSPTARKFSELETGNKTLAI